MQGKRYGRAVIAALVAASLAAPGCVKKPQQDAFIKHWDTMANKSEGYTPTAHPRKIEKEQAAITTTKQVREEAKPVRRLPTQRVTLRMYDTDLVAVVRAMARAANQNVVLSSSIPGSANGGQGGLRINVNVADAPWDETFKSILVSNGLTYAIDGDIVRVMTLADMEQQNKLKEADNKLAAEAARAKSMEPYETWKVEVNFADLDELAVTLNSLCGNSAVGQGAGNKTGSNATGAPTTDPARSTNIAVSDPVKGPTPALPALGDYKLGLLKGFVIPDHYSNSLVIQASNADAEKIIQLIEKLDQPRPQIRLKAFIVQTDRTTAQQLGIQWGGLLKNSNFQMSPAQAGTITGTNSSANTGTTTATSTTTGGTAGSTLATSSTGTNTTTGGSNLTNALSPIFGGGTSGQGFAINNPANLTAAATGLGAAGTGINFLFGKIGENVLEAQLTALAEDNKVKILSSPTITTMENKEAYTENGKKIPYVSTSQNGTNVQFADALLRLEMLPHVIDGTNLRMKIVVKDDQVDENQSNWVQGNPPIYKRETRSTLVVEDGDTIVISGLTRDTITDGQSGVPLLRDIPGLGWAFKSKSNSVEREQILIFVTPKILKEKPVAPVPPVADRVDPQALARGPVAAAEVVKP